jgi:integrase
LIYTPDKTRKKEKVVDMAISEKMASILQEMDGMNDYVFPIFKTDPAMAISRPVVYKGRVNRAAFHMNEALKEIRALAGINKHITIHVARHTFAYLADKSGVSLGDIQRTLNHGSIETTSKYLRSMRESDELDKATEGLF